MLTRATGSILRPTHYPVAVAFVLVAVAINGICAQPAPAPPSEPSSTPALPPPLPAAVPAPPPGEALPPVAPPLPPGAPPGTTLGPPAAPGIMGPPETTTNPAAPPSGIPGPTTEPSTPGTPTPAPTGAPPPFPGELPGITPSPTTQRPPRPGNFTTDYNGTNTTEPVVALLLNLNATSGRRNASGPCFDRGFYHLSCYNFTGGANATNATAPAGPASPPNITLDNVTFAKSQCLADWAQTRAARGCNVSADLVGANAFNCSIFFIYHFNSLTCRRSYQAQERNNTNCTAYADLGLANYAGKASLRNVDYRCGGTL